MASTVHHNSHQALLLRPLPTPSRHPRLSFSPRPAGLRSFFPASGCRLGTHGVALAEPEFVPLQEEEEEEDARFVVVTFYKFVPLDDPHAEVARHLNFLQVLLSCSTSLSSSTTVSHLLHPIYHIEYGKRCDFLCVGVASV